MSILYVFNPEHDLSLANGSPFFNAPLSAQQFAKDCSYLLSWMFDDGYVLVDEKEVGYGNLENVCSEELSSLAIDKIVPWGWDAMLVNTLQKLGVESDLLPTAEQQNIIRTLSHRQTAIDALKWIKTQIPLDVELPSFMTNSSDAKVFFENVANRNAVYKMPWSGSGKGIRYCVDTLTENDFKWLENVVVKQGGVVGERYYDVVQNFAMEFCVTDKVEFVGYSLFDTQNGSYKSSALVSDAVAVERLSKWVVVDVLEQCKAAIIRYFSECLLQKYEGYFGVDMFVYFDGNDYKLHPIVEINFRLTMGVVACKIRERLLENDNMNMYVYYNKSTEKLKEYCANLQQNNPLIRSENGKIKLGYFSLTPIGNQTHYHIYLLYNGW